MHAHLRMALRDARLGHERESREPATCDHGDAQEASKLLNTPDHFALGTYFLFLF